MSNNTDSSLDYRKRPDSHINDSLYSLMASQSSTALAAATASIHRNPATASSSSLPAISLSGSSSSSHQDSKLMYNSNIIKMKHSDENLCCILTQHIEILLNQINSLKKVIACNIDSCTECKKKNRISALKFSSSKSYTNNSSLNLSNPNFSSLPSNDISKFDDSVFDNILLSSSTSNDASNPGSLQQIFNQDMINILYNNNTKKKSFIEFLNNLTQNDKNLINKLLLIYKLEYLTQSNTIYLNQKITKNFIINKIKPNIKDICPAFITRIISCAFFNSNEKEIMPTKRSFEYWFNSASTNASNLPSNASSSVDNTTGVNSTDTLNFITGPKRSSGDDEDDEEDDEHDDMMLKKRP